jgi:D-3-phosphoglycerate dehydrogenase
MLDAGRLSLIVRAGAGYNTIDVAAASRRGIYVANCPGKNAIAVAELAFGLLLSIDRRIPDNVAELRAGKWNKKEYSKARGLYGRTLVLLGVGSIGQEMIRRAAGFGMNVVIWSRRFDGQDIERVLRSIAIGLAPTPADAMSRGDVVSIHLALGPETKGLVNAALLSKMKPGAVLINTARGEVVDYAAVAAAVKDRGLRVGLDVYANEPASAAAATRKPGTFPTW